MAAGDLFDCVGWIWVFANAMRTLALGLGTLLLGTSLLAAEPKPMTLDEAESKHVLAAVSQPVSDPSLKIKGVHGEKTGIFDLKFDYKTGHLREVHVVQSTGYKNLDIAAITALEKWRAKPHSVHILRVPMTFGL